MSKYKALTISAVTAAMLCLISPFSIPIFGVIPITLATFIIYIAAYLLDTKKLLSSICVYILLGIIGLPVFSGFSGGIGVIMSATGGFIIGYIPMSLLLSVGFKVKRSSILWNASVMITATVILYIIGTLWFMIITGAETKTALMTCIIPFLAGDGLKIIVSLALAETIKLRFSKIKENL